MKPDSDQLKHQALSLLQEACCPYGILASPLTQDNYRRLWSRDAMIAGIAGLLAGDEKVIEGFQNSILTLAQHQHPRGMIPSNLRPDQEEPEISFGGVAGRVDATTWFLTGTCLYLLYQGDRDQQRKLQPHLIQCLEILDRWEFNGGGLLYTPLSGNWADEFPVEGHTLYDNALRLWGVQLYAALYQDQARAEQARLIRERITINFWPDTANAGHPAVYHRRGFEEAASESLSHFACSLGPGGYRFRFDTAGHALALLLGLADEPQLDAINRYIQQLFGEIGRKLLPAFWPVIKPGSCEWETLQKNYSYEFKNEPHRFHNGGIWPVWMGLFGLAMSRNGSEGIARNMLEAWMEIEDPQNLHFYEYIASDTLEGGGKKQLSYSASGLLFLLEAIEPTTPERRLVH